MSAANLDLQSVLIYFMALKPLSASADSTAKNEMYLYHLISSRYHEPLAQKVLSVVTPLTLNMIKNALKLI